MSTTRKRTRFGHPPGRIATHSVRVSCGVCGGSEVMSLPRGAIPSGWCRTGDLGWICPKHLVTLSPDGTKVETPTVAAAEGGGG